MSWKWQLLEHERPLFKGCSLASPTLGKLTEDICLIISLALWFMQALHSQFSITVMIRDTSGEITTSWILSTIFKCFMILANLSWEHFFSNKNELEVICLFFKLLLLMKKGSWSRTKKGLSGVWNLPAVTHNVNNPYIVCINKCPTEAAAQPLKCSSAPVNNR